MNLQQIEAVCGVVRNDLNFSTAADALQRSQPTLSRQIQDLERELGVRIFTRTRNKVVGLTPEGEVVLRIGQRIVQDVRNLAQAGNSESAETPAELKIATTHLHARYSLPQVIKSFATRHPGVLLTLRQGDPIQCCELVAAGEADIGITTVGKKTAGEIVTIPAFRLARCVIAPRDHPIAREKTLTLRKLAQYPIVAYSAPFSGRWIVEEAFARAGLRPHVVCSAIDADVSKTYVELGMGIAVLARVAFEPARDRNLVAIPADHLFRPSIVNLVLRKHGHLSRHAREFLSMFAPHIGADLVRKSMDGTELDRGRLSQNAPLAISAQLPAS
jgi:LysR family cys regulon transcriptional activator